MNDLKEYIESGVLEMYVLGMASVDEIREVEELASSNVEVQKEIGRISEALKLYSELNINAPNNTIKPMILASIDYEERLKKGEQPCFPPILSDNSKIEDFSEWLTRKDIIKPSNFKDIFVKIIGYTPQASTAVVWIESETPYEVHTDEHEKFLILEGTCDIDIDGNIHSLIPGNYLSIPLYAGHIVKVTSDIPCKVILQRVAA